MGSMDFYFRDFFTIATQNAKLKIRAGPYGEFFEKVLDVGHSY